MGHEAGGATSTRLSAVPVPGATPAPPIGGGARVRVSTKRTLASGAPQGPSEAVVQAQAEVKRAEKVNVPVASAFVTQTSVPAGAAGKSPREQTLFCSIAADSELLAKPASQLPVLEVGQGIVWVGDARNSRVEYKITAVDAEGVKLAVVRGDPKVKYLSRAALATMLNTPSVGWEMRESPDIESARVPSIAEEAFARIDEAQLELADLEWRRRLGPKNYAITSSLLRHRAELAYDQAVAAGALRGWLDTHNGYSSMIRIVHGLAVAQLPASDPSAPWKTFKRIATNAEQYHAAPQRETIAKLQTAIAALDDALARLNAGKSMGPGSGLNLKADPVLTEMSEFATGNQAELPVARTLAVRLSFLQDALAADPMPVGDAWVAYHAAVQPYLFLKARDGSSFHHTADGTPSLTFAINQAIGHGELGDRRLIRSSQDLIALREEARKHWPQVFAQQETLCHRSSIASPGWRPTFAAAAFDAEIARLQAIERGPKHLALRAVLDQANLDSTVAKIKNAEPAFVATFGRGVLNIVDSPEFWAMMAIGAVTAGAASGAVLGEAAVDTAELVNLVRAGNLSLRAVGLFAASTAIDGAAFQTGMNAFNLLIGKSDEVDFSAAAYARSIAFMGVSQLASVRHALRQAQLAPSLLRHAGEAARYFAEEATGMGIVAGGETLLRQGNLDGAFASFEQSLHFLVAMRLAHSTQSALGVRAKAENNRLDELELALRRAEAKYTESPTEESLLAAYTCLRDYAAQLKAVNDKLYERGLAKGQEIAPEARKSGVGVVPARAEIAKAQAALSNLSTDQAERAKTMAVVELAARDPNATIVSSKPFDGGHINKTYRVVLSNGLVGVWKPVKGQYTTEVRDKINVNTQGQREAAAYLVDKTMGHLAGVPPTTYRHFGGDAGALLVFVDKASYEDVAAQQGITLKPEHRMRGAVFDQVIGNLDRHGENYLVTDNGDLVPIDHGLVLPKANGPQGFANMDFAFDAPLARSHVQAVEALIKRRSLVTKQLTDLGIEPEAIDAMFARAKQMLAVGRTGDYWTDDAPRPNADDVSTKSWKGPPPGGATPSSGPGPAATPQTLSMDTVPNAANATTTPTGTTTRKME